MAPPGTSSVEVQVYDVAKKIDGLSMTADVMRFQAENGQLQGTRLFAVSNSSSPPKTQMNDHNFEFYLPAGAKIEQAQAKAPNGQPISAETTPQAEKNRYAIMFPLRPGETQFQIEFTLPYSGSIKIDPKPLYPAEHVVVVLPKSMQFAAANASTYQSMQDPSQGDTVVQVAQQTQPGQSLGFTLSGTGTISESPAQVASGAAQGRENRPGGGLGAPIDAPDPLQKYKLPIHRWIRRDPRDRRLGGDEAAAGHGRSSRCDHTRYRGLCCAAQIRAGGSARHISGRRARQQVIAAAGSAERRDVSARSGTKAKTHHTGGIRKGQGGIGPDFGSGTEETGLEKRSPLTAYSPTALQEAAYSPRTAVETRLQ